MANMNLDQNIHYVPLLNYAQKTANYVAPHINMKLYEKVQFYIKCEALATDDFVVTVTQSAVTAGSASTAIIAGGYRISASGGTDTMGDVVACPAAGFSILNTNDNKTYIVDVESQHLTTADKPYVGLTFTNPGTANAYLVIWALCWPKYPKKTNASALT